MAGEIISERRARSNRNAGRHHRGFAGDFPPNPHAGRTMPSVRRLTAILAADVAGCSPLMGADEEGTHERLKAHRHALVDPEIAEHHGRIVKTVTQYRTGTPASA